MKWELRDKMLDAFDELIANNTRHSQKLWSSFVELHPADGAELLAEFSWAQLRQFFDALKPSHQAALFPYFSRKLQRYSLSFLPEVDARNILRNMNLDDIVDLFDYLSGAELRKYTEFLDTASQKKVLSLLQFDSQSAGGVMDPDVLAFDHNLTVDEAVKIMQKLQPRQEVYRKIFLTDANGVIAGFISLEDLVLRGPEVKLKSFAQESPVIFTVDVDQEEVAKKMRHYELVIAPVVDIGHKFLGVITGDILVEVVGEEASEDMYKMSALRPMEGTYFQTSFGRLFLERAGILVALLLAQSISSSIIQRYEATLAGLLMYFITMLISTGGNSSSQTSALVIQGMASGEVNHDNMMRFLRREVLMAGSLAAILGIVAFGRTYYVCNNFWPSLAVSLSLSTIVMVSVVLGSAIPIGLKKLNIDPAFSAGPFLATLMDIIGVFIYCYISTLILF
jgi:magnesium transporter